MILLIPAPSCHSKKNKVPQIPDATVHLIVISQVWMHHWTLYLQWIRQGNVVSWTLKRKTIFLVASNIRELASYLKWNCQWSWYHFPEHAVFLLNLTYWVLRLSSSWHLLIITWLQKRLIAMIQRYIYPQELKRLFVICHEPMNFNSFFRSVYEKSHKEKITSNRLGELFECIPRSIGTSISVMQETTYNLRMVCRSGVK